MNCPNCAEPVAAADRYCEQCGTDLLVHRTPVGGPLAETGGPCAHCGSAEFTDGFCEQCGRARPAGRDRMEFDLGVVAGVADRGRERTRNEDSMAFARLGPAEDPRAVVAVVCDGVASTERADQASQAAADAAVEVLAGAVLEDGDGDPTAATNAAVAAAVARVAELANREPPGSAPSCTFVSAVVTRDAITVGWVGDSRGYWLSTVDESRQLTLDDTVAAQLVAAGMAEAEAARVYNAHALSSWIGADAGDVEPHVTTLEPAGPGALVLCSDGLWNYLPAADDLAAKVPFSSGHVDPMRAATELTQVALDLGGHDNITVVVISYPLKEAGE